MRLYKADNARPRRIPIVSLLMVGGVMVALAGCGGSSNTSSSASTSSPAASTPAATESTPTTTAAPPGALSLAASSEGQLKFNTTTLSAKAGNVVIDFTNMASLAHNVTVESASGSTVGATPTFQGESKTLTLNLKAGTYKFYCSVPGHRQGGMEGTLTVK